MPSPKILMMWGYRYLAAEDHLEAPYRKYNGEWPMDTPSNRRAHAMVI